MIERVVLVSPRGFCAGVERAIAIVERALAIFPPPVFVRRAIVHNASVVARLAAAGARFVDELDEVPAGAVVIFSAHGVPAAVRDQARARDLRIIDATCPLVAKVHREVRRFSDRGFDVVLIGHPGHDEVVGTLGQSPGVHLIEQVADVEDLRLDRPGKAACVTQTTLSPQDVGPVLDALRRRFPTLVQPPAADVCYATRNRQTAIAWLARQVDVVLVIGDPTSSNSRRLCEVASAACKRAHLIAGAAELRARWLTDARIVGVSAGASTPEEVVREVVAHLCRQGAVVQEELIADERVAFGLPGAVASIPGAIGSGPRGADFDRDPRHRVPRRWPARLPAANRELRPARVSVETCAGPYAAAQTGVTP